jgi:Protein of unknown function (DUF1376)
MPLDVVRLRDSDLALIATGDEFRAAVLLWCAAWYQVPAASLPSDERALAKLAGVDAREWGKVREGAMRGWVLCDDGRLYHPVVAEKALEAWRGRQAYQRRREVDRERLKDWRSKQRRGSVNETPSETVGETYDETRFETRKRETGTGTVYSAPTEQAATPCTPDQETPDQEAWRRGAALLCRQGRMTEGAARKLFGKLLGKYKLAPGDLLPSIVKAEGVGTPDPQSYLTAAAKAIGDRKLTRTPVPDEWGADEWATACRLWRDEGSWSTSMGPRPGEPGCMAPPTVLAEFGFAVDPKVVPLVANRGATW